MPHKAPPSPSAAPPIPPPTMRRRSRELVDRERVAQARVLGDRARHHQRALCPRLHGKHLRRVSSGDGRIEAGLQAGGGVQGVAPHMAPQRPTPRSRRAWLHPAGGPGGTGGWGGRSGVLGGGATGPRAVVWAGGRLAWGAGRGTGGVQAEGGARSHLRPAPWAGGRTCTLVATSAAGGSGAAPSSMYCSACTPRAGSQAGRHAASGTAWIAGCAGMAANVGSGAKPGAPSYVYLCWCGGGVGVEDGGAVWQGGL